MPSEEFPLSTPNEDSVSVVIPARNEEANIAKTVRSVAGQNLAFEIIVIDDGSADRTGEILKRLESEIPRLRVIRLDSLPEGWTGKTYAAATGANSAKGGWLLFTDADAVHLPGSLNALLNRAVEGDADLLSVSPGQETVAWWERAVIPRVFVELARWFPFEEVSNPDSTRAAANGQYILIKRETYERAGGFESVRGEILEDVALAQRVKAQGGKIIFLPGAEWVRTRMYRSLGAMWEGWTKNLFPLTGCDSGHLLAALGGCLADSLPALAWVALLLWLFLRVGKTEWSSPAEALVSAGVLALWLASGAFYVTRRRNFRLDLATLGYDGGVANGLTVGSVLLALLLLNSWTAYRVSHRVEWKGRNYPVKKVQK